MFGLIDVKLVHIGYFDVKLVHMLSQVLSFLTKFLKKLN
jgi:hypothetical protein